MHIGGWYPCSGEGLFAVLSGGAAHVSFQVSQAGTTGAGADVAASRAYWQIARSDGTHLVELLGIAPYVHEFLTAHVTAWQRKLDAGKQVAIGRDVTRRVPCAAWELLQDIVVHRGRRRAELIDVAHQICIAKYILQLRHTQAQSENRPVPIH